MKWFVLASADAKRELMAIVAECGGTVTNPEGYAFDVATCAAVTGVDVRGKRPDYVVLHFNAAKPKWLHAGFWVGMGVPLVYIGRESGAQRVANDAAKILGAYRLASPETFRSFLRRGDQERLKGVHRAAV